MSGSCVWMCPFPFCISRSQTQQSTHVTQIFLRPNRFNPNLLRAHRVNPTAGRYYPNPIVAGIHRNSDLVTVSELDGKFVFSWTNERQVEGRGTFLLQGDYWKLLPTASVSLNIVKLSTDTIVLLCPSRPESTLTSVTLVNDSMTTRDWSFDGFVHLKNADPNAFTLASQKYEWVLDPATETFTRMPASKTAAEHTVELTTNTALRYFLTGPVWTGST